ncbi:MAG TPA: glycosyltransferase, partial [Gemmatimonadales bacterium]|nr:glycosyltransferase [Gemmatimonadales bacterium]
MALVATCPPRQCGIATFTSDLARAIRQAEPATRIRWAAIDEGDGAHLYGPEVQWRMSQEDPASYAATAVQLNASAVDVVSVQHEFGLYGIWGERFEDHLAPFLEVLHKPLVVTLHTVLPEPSPSVREAVRQIGHHSAAVVVMAELARQILVDSYGLSADNVHVIPHGVPPVQPK